MSFIASCGHVLFFFVGFQRLVISFLQSLPGIGDRSFFLNMFQRKI